MKFPSLLLALLALTALATASAADTHWVYFGTYTRGDSPSKGIYRSSFNADTGALGQPEVAAEMGSPSFLEIAPSKKFLYAVGETSGGGTGKGVAAFTLDPASGQLAPINAVTAVGEGPCHVNLDPSGRMVGIANYGSGSIVSYQVRKDGGLSDPVSFIQHEGSSIDPKRQAGPHAHSINFSPDGRFAYACDLGLDKVFIYQTDPASGSLTPAQPPFATVPAGGGPRHLAIHPDGTHVFVNNEMALTVTSFRRDAETGALTEIETTSTLPAGEKPGPGLSTAETLVHPSGKFVYVSNRGHDTVAVFAWDPDAEKLTLVQNAKCEGSIPRNIRLDPSGRWMIMAHQKTQDVAVFAVDSATGKLTFTGTKHPVGAPVCIRFVPVAGS
ncbi:MAG: lactonase family protein [Verrucomicrobiales bacterium]|nr:lactonase family protein [Verrucomicrobiales bacterium]